MNYRPVLRVVVVDVKGFVQAMLEQDIILNFPEHGLHLRFEPSSQRLRLIEVYDTSRIQVIQTSAWLSLIWPQADLWGLTQLSGQLTPLHDVQLRYGKGLLGGAAHAATAVLVYELLGPTAPRAFESAAAVYPLHYPGLLFLFPIPPRYLQYCQEHSEGRPLEFPDNTTPVASRICIYSGSAGQHHQAL